MLGSLSQIHTNNEVLKRRAAQILKNQANKIATKPEIKTESSMRKPIPNHPKK